MPHTAHICHTQHTCPIHTTHIPYTQHTHAQHTYALHNTHIPQVQDVDTNRIRQVVVARATIDLPSPVEYRMENKNGMIIVYCMMFYVP